MRILLSLPLTVMVAMLSTEGLVAAVPLMVPTAARAAHLFTVGQQVVVVAPIRVLEERSMVGVAVDGGHILLVWE